MFIARKGVGILRKHFLVRISSQSIVAPAIGPVNRLLSKNMAGIGAITAPLRGPRPSEIRTEGLFERRRDV
jgi:hypothetical protein